MLNFDNFEVLTFDCYGTLIDWETGIWDALGPILANHRIVTTPDQALELFAVFESQAESGEYREYKDVLRLVLEGIGARLGFIPTTTELQHFCESVRDWPP